MTATLLHQRTVEKNQVNFVCQRCRQPLKTDLSFENIDQQNELVKELTGMTIMLYQF